MKYSLDVGSSEAVCYIRACCRGDMLGVFPRGTEPDWAGKEQEHWVIFTCVFQRKRGAAAR